MDASQNLPELVAAAQVTAKASTDRIAEILDHLDGRTGSEAQMEDLRAATVELEAVAVDTYTLFEARMQHHFKRGPFSRKLKALLLDNEQADLADRVHQHYLAINVLKHGIGASHRALLATPNCLFGVKQSVEEITDEARPPAGLVDVSVPGFFAGLTATVLEAYEFLENR
ncbi:MAG: hypothetical protein ACI84R_003716 [Candidatus Azotimanducaceae bacterium]|jgi:hypothetical protein